MGDDEFKRQQVSRLRKRLDGPAHATAEEVYLLCGKPLYIFLRSRIRHDPDLLGEVFQETLFRICLKRDQIPPAGEAVYWVVTMAGLILKETYRMGAHFPRADPERYADDTAAAPRSGEASDDALLREDADNFIYAHLGLLTEQERVIFLHVYDDDMEPWEICARYGLSVQTVHNHLSRARKKLRKLIETFYFS